MPPLKGAEGGHPENFAIFKQKNAELPYPANPKIMNHISPPTGYRAKISISLFDVANIPT